MNTQLIPTTQSFVAPALPKPNIKPAAMLEEDELLSRASSFDERAIGEVYARYEGKIYAFLYRRVGDPNIAEDLTAQVFLKMLEAIRNGHTWRTSFSGWLYRIAHNLLVDHYRDCAKQTYVPLDDAPPLSTSQHNPVRLAERRLEVERLRAAIRRLTDDQALVISLRFIERCSINEVAEMLDKTEGAVKALQHRALATLHQLLENEELWDV